jgi:uncharacterized protein (DUF885 family)
VAAWPAMSDARARLWEVADRYWEAYLEFRPTVATLHGDHRYDDRIEDVSADAEARLRATALELRADVDAVDPAGLDVADRVTQRLLRAELTGAVETIDVRGTELRSDQMTGFHAELLVIAPQIKAPTPESARALLERYRGIGPFLDQAVGRLRAGLAAGRTPARINVERSLNQLEKYLASPLEKDPFTTLAGPPDWDGEAAWRAELAELARAVIRPAFGRYRDFFRSELLPAGRPHEQAGLCWLADDGAALYDHFVRRYTTVDDLTAEEIHQIGLDELDRLAGEYAEVGGQLFGTTDQAEIFDRLRSDPALRYDSGDEIMGDARRYLAAATAAMGQWFGRLPKSPCDVTPVPSALAQDMPVAYYFPPANDGSRPGTYFVNTADPGHKNRYETASVAYHEAIPGHHLQLAIATELDDVPTFQRLSSNGKTAFVEGWGLYAERLAAEMGLYADDLERIGMLAADSWRSCRLVVDTGLHALGWGRQQAIDFMAANAPVSVGEIEVEVDRYIGLPGQALAYKVGQREILRLRADARDRLGARFDIRAFHDVVLGSSSVTLPVLRHLVDDWTTGAA